MATQTEALKLLEEYIVHVRAMTEHITAIKEALAQPEQETQAYREAARLAEWLFKTHYAQEEHYASGRVVWGLCDTTSGVISQIDNMVCKLVLPKEPEQEPFGYFKPEPFGWTDCAETDEGAIALYDRPQRKE